MKNLVVFLIFGIFVVLRLLKAAAEQQERQQTDREEDWDEGDWDEWKPDSGRAPAPPVASPMTPSPPPRPAPPMARPMTVRPQHPHPHPPMAQPMAQPMARPAPQQTPPPAPRPQPVVRAPAPVIQTFSRPAPASQPQPTPPEKPLVDMSHTELGMTQKAEAVAAVTKRTREVARASLGAAMPARSRLVRPIRVGARRRIPLAATGRGRLRQAVLMREVLARPRAFDL